MNTTVKGLLSDFLRAAIIVAAILAIVAANASALHVPAAWVGYVAIAAGIVNSAIGLVKPYAVAAVTGKPR